jgi:hypothetical protein
MALLKLKFYYFNFLQPNPLQNQQCFNEVQHSFIDQQQTASLQNISKCHAEIIVSEYDDETLDGHP